MTMNLAFTDHQQSKKLILKEIIKRGLILHIREFIVENDPLFIGNGSDNEFNGLESLVVAQSL